MSERGSTKSSAAANMSKEKKISAEDKPAKSSILNKHTSGKNRTKYTKLFDNVLDKPKTRSPSPRTQASPVKVLAGRREKYVNTTDFASKPSVLSKKVPEQTVVQVKPETNKKKEESTGALGKSSEKKSPISKPPKKTVLTAENYDREMFKICSNIVDEFLKKARADKNADEKNTYMTYKKKAQKSTTFGQITTVDVKKKPVTSAVRQSLEKECTVIDKPDKITEEEKKKEPEKKKSKNFRKKMKKLMKLREEEQGANI